MMGVTVGTGLRGYSPFIRWNGYGLDEIFKDICDEFRSLIQKLSIPYKEEENSFYIYGYVEISDIFGDLLK